LFDDSQCLPHGFKAADAASGGNIPNKKIYRAEDKDMANVCGRWQQVISHSWEMLALFARWQQVVNSF